jgi:Tol biopolymer transport system component
VIDLDQPRVLKPVDGVPADAQVVEFAWSPDGKWIVYTIGASNVLNEEELKKLESRLVVADTDGKNAKVLASVKGQLILGVDWR